MTQSAETWKGIVDQVKQSLAKSHDASWERIAYELQDDFRFLLISIQVDDEQRNPANIARICAAVRSAVKQVPIPKRKDDYSWMAVVTHGDVTIESIFE